MSEITLPAVQSNLEALTAFVDGILEENDCNLKSQMQIDVVIDEIFSNIVLYAYEDTGDVTVRVEISDGNAEITFIDSGREYNPIEKDDPDITLSAEDRPIGGLGIFIVKKTMDEVKYRYESNQNILTVIKKI